MGVLRNTVSTKGGQAGLKFYIFYAKTTYRFSQKIYKFSLALYFITVLLYTIKCCTLVKEKFKMYYLGNGRFIVFIKVMAIKLKELSSDIGRSLVLGFIIVLFLIGLFIYDSNTGVFEKMAQNVLGSFVAEEDKIGVKSVNTDNPPLIDVDSVEIEAE
jgi:hypothetical protein